MGLGVGGSVCRRRTVELCGCERGGAAQEHAALHGARAREAAPDHQVRRHRQRGGRCDEVHVTAAAPAALAALAARAALAALAAF